MRVDQLMNRLCLTKSRTIAKKAGDLGLLKINGHLVKASSVMHDGDILEYALYGYQMRIKIIKVPTGNVAKKNATEYYEILEREKTDVYIEEE